MNRFLMMFIFFPAICMFCTLSPSAIHAEGSENSKQTLTQEQAAELAARLANEKFQKDYRRSPFTPESYPAVLIDTRWHWGKIDPIGINGCSAAVEFNEEGSDEKVKVALHVDTLNIKDNIKEKVPIELKVVPEKDGQTENPVPEIIQKK
jgi:hypothetical protein